MEASRAQRIHFMQRGRRARGNWCKRRACECEFECGCVSAEGTWAVQTDGNGTVVGMCHVEHIARQNGGGGVG